MGYVTHSDIFSESCKSKLNLDCNYTLPIGKCNCIIKGNYTLPIGKCNCIIKGNYTLVVITPNGILFGAQINH